MTEETTDRLSLYEQARETLRTALREDENPGFSGARSGETDPRMIELATRRWRAFNALLDAKTAIIRCMDSIERDFARARPYFEGGSGYFNEHGLLQTTGAQLEAQCARFSLLVDAALQAEVDFQEAQPDIWHDDEGIWLQIDGQTLGPFATEAEAEAAEVGS